MNSSREIAGAALEAYRKQYWMLEFLCLWDTKWFSSEFHESPPVKQLGR